MAASEKDMIRQDTVSTAVSPASRRVTGTGMLSKYGMNCNRTEPLSWDIVNIRERHCRFASGCVHSLPFFGFFGPVAPAPPASRHLFLKPANETAQPNGEICNED